MQLPMNEPDTSRILAVDWGAKRIGLALSDPTRTIASPLMVLAHTSRAEDAAAILKIATEKDASLILVGVTYEDDHQLTPAGRSAQRLVEAMQEQHTIEVRTYDESYSTQTARESRLLIGLPKSKRKGHFDAIAAVVFLQRYLDERA
ncbi:putative Holliday junction resolvase [Pelolinea submarina]|uniref:Putative pre-16S rRNA nuclease n=2 Tax=Pelolinea submarina TaxID=913107 RepID=A0A3E0AG98_9CHLR|nr:putative Holliday junction resolvase [Pelolinea submarina]